MVPPKQPFSYAAAAAGASAPKPALEAPEEDTGLDSDLQKLVIQGGNTTVTSQEQDLTIPDSTGGTAPAVVETSYQENVDSSRRTARIDSSAATSVSGNDETNHSHTSISTSTGFSAREEKLGDMVKRHSRSPRLFPWASMTSTRQASQGFTPLSAVGSTKARQLSPPRGKHASRFFPSPQNDLESKEMGLEQTKLTRSAFATSEILASPFFPNGLSGGLIRGSSNVEDQVRNIGKSVDSYVTSHYSSTDNSPTSSIGATTSRETQSGQVPERKHMRLISDLSDDDSKTPTAIYRAPIPTIPEEEDASYSSDDEDGGVSLAHQSTQQAAHGPHALPFAARRATTIQDLEYAADNSDAQKYLCTTRPRSSWDDVPNWRTQPSSGSLVPHSGPHTRFAFPSTDLTNTQSKTHGAIGYHGTHTAFKPFRPLNAVLNPDACKQPLSPQDQAYRQLHGISMNYLGNHENPRNISADISDSENCAVWITNLPAHCTHTVLIKALTLHHPGRIWATHINPPVQAQHTSAAAKVVFYDPTEAQTLLKLARMGSGIYVQGRRINAILNKQRVAAQLYSDATSRAVEIAGDAALVNERFLRDLFRAHFQWDDEAIEVRAEWDGKRVIEWRFGSMRAQAEAAYKLLTQQYPCLQVRYVGDPCSSLTAANQSQLDEIAKVERDNELTRRAGGSRALTWRSQN